MCFIACIRCLNNHELSSLIINYNIHLYLKNKKINISGSEPILKVNKKIANISPKIEILKLHLRLILKQIKNNALNLSRMYFHIYCSSSCLSLILIYHHYLIRICITL